MIARQEVLDTYWRFAAMRQEVFFNRLSGKPAPWTDDPILNEYKFCNAYRASDRVSQFLIREVIYSDDADDEDIIFRILLFKIFNKTETWQALEKGIGKISLQSFDFKSYAKVLERQLGLGQPIYTPAYMSCAHKAFGYDRKHLNHLALIDKICSSGGLSRIIKARSLEEVFSILRSYPLIGDFMAYQLSIDINYSEAINFSENDFTIAGPGAKRGIKKCFVDLEGASETDVIRMMQKGQSREFKERGLDFKTLFGRELQLIDCQGLFCETDKYSRVAFPGIKSQRKRIKSRFSSSKERIDFFYPPKWKLNDMITSS